MLPIPAKLILFRDLGYDPHERQMLGHASAARLLLVVGAERSGKSMFTAMELVADLFCIDDPRPVRIAVGAQTYDECHKEMEYIAAALEALGLLSAWSHPKQGKWTIETDLQGWVETISFKEGANELTGTGEPYDTVALVEAGRIEKEAHTAARMRVSERRGRVLLSGTLWNDFGWYNDLHEVLQGPNRFGGETYSFPMWFNLAIFPGGRKDPEILALEEELPENEFKRRVCALGVPSVARIYPEFSHEVHVADLEYDPAAPVALTIDPGYFPSRYAALAIQTGVDALGRDVIYVIDELWEHNLLHEEVIGILQERPWWENVEKIWGGHETKAHAMAGPTTADVWRKKTGLPFEVVTRPSNKKLTYMRVKTFLKDDATLGPRLFINVSCKGLLYEFRHYERKTDAWGVVISDDPASASENDALDTLANYTVGRYGLVDRTAFPKGRPGSDWTGAIG